MPSYGIALHYEFGRDRYIELCRQIDDLGFGNLWVPDERFMRDMAVGLTLAGMSTKRVTIGTAVTDPYIRHPALTATLMATLDEVSGGRLVMGIGAGVSGFDAVGIKRQHPQLAMREAIALMRELWNGGVVDYTGKTTSFHGGKLDFTPVRSDIPVWIAGRGPAVLQLAGEVANGVMIGSFASEPGLRYATAAIDRGIERGGRDASSLTRALWLHTAISENADAARDAVRNVVTGVLISSQQILDEVSIPVPRDLRQSLLGVTYGMTNPAMLRIARNVPDNVLSHFSVAGGPAEVRERMDEFGRLGIDHIAVVPWLTEGQTIEGFVHTLASALL